MRGQVVNVLYNDHEVWKIFGYQGASFEEGGYLYRGFDDLSWLPEPPDEASRRRKIDREEPRWRRPTN
ncbi:MAG: hypothetical protein HC871_12680 [Rhizobiales bacterium]|nr:hypothetical protein [Hyphomicrobiales bacterium]